MHVGTLIYTQKRICIHKIKPYTKIPLVSFAIILGCHIFTSSFYSSHLKGWVGFYFTQIKMPPRMSIPRSFPLVDYWDSWLPPRATRTKLGVIPLEISVQQYVVKCASVRPRMILNLFGKSLIFSYQGVLCCMPYSSPVSCSEPQKGKSAAFGYWIVKVSCMGWCSALTDVCRAGVAYVRDCLPHGCTFVFSWSKHYVWSS